MVPVSQETSFDEHKKTCYTSGVGKRWWYTFYKTVELGQLRTVSEVHIAHAEAGGESPDMNSRAYTILVSEDGKDFEAVSRILSNEAADTNNIFAAKEVRYVKLSIDKPSQGADSAARIYEVQVFGMDK